MLSVKYIYIAMWDDEMRQTNEWRWTIYNRWYIINNEQWDDDDIDFRQDTTNNEKWWIMRYDKFQKQYSMTNVIDNEIRAVTKQ